MHKLDELNRWFTVCSSVHFVIFVCCNCIHSIDKTTRNDKTLCVNIKWRKTILSWFFIWFSMWLIVCYERIIIIYNSQINDRFVTDIKYRFPNQFYQEIEHEQERSTYNCVKEDDFFISETCSQCLGLIANWIICENESCDQENIFEIEFFLNYNFQ